MLPVAICEELQNQPQMLQDISLSLSQMLSAKQPEQQQSLQARFLKCCKVRLGTLLSLMLIERCAEPLHDPSGCIGGAQNAEALFRQTQIGAQQVGQQAYQQASAALPGSNAADAPQSPIAAEPAADLSQRTVRGRMLTFVSGGGKAVLSSSVASSSPSAQGQFVTSGALTLQNSAQALARFCMLT